MIDSGSLSLTRFVKVSGRACRSTADHTTMFSGLEGGKVANNSSWRSNNSNNDKFHESLPKGASCNDQAVERETGNHLILRAQHSHQASDQLAYVRMRSRRTG